MTRLVFPVLSPSWKILKRILRTEYSPKPLRIVLRQSRARGHVRVRVPGRELSIAQAFEFLVGNVYEVQRKMVRVQFPQLLVYRYDVPWPVIVRMMGAVVRKRFPDALSRLHRTHHGQRSALRSHNRAVVTFVLAQSFVLMYVSTELTDNTRKSEALIRSSFHFNLFRSSSGTASEASSGLLSGAGCISMLGGRAARISTPSSIRRARVSWPSGNSMISPIPRRTVNIYNTS